MLKSRLCIALAAASAEPRDRFEVVRLDRSSGTSATVEIAAQVRIPDLMPGACVLHASVPVFACFCPCIGVTGTSATVEIAAQVPLHALRVGI